MHLRARNSGAAYKLTGEALEASSQGLGDLSDVAQVRSGFTRRSFSCVSCQLCCRHPRGERQAGASWLSRRCRRRCGRTARRPSTNHACHQRARAARTCRPCRTLRTSRAPLVFDARSPLPTTWLALRRTAATSRQPRQSTSSSLKTCPTTGTAACGWPAWQRRGGTQRCAGPGLLPASRSKRLQRFWSCAAAGGTATSCNSGASLPHVFHLPLPT